MRLISINNMWLILYVGNPMSQRITTNSFEIIKVNNQKKYLIHQHPKAVKIYVDKGHLFLFQFKKFLCSQGLYIYLKIYIFEQTLKDHNMGCKMLFYFFG